MSNRSGDFGLQSTDPPFALHLGAADAASSTAYSPHTHEHYEAERSASDAGAQPSAQEATLRYSDYSAHQPSLSQFPHYGFAAGAPMAWDWDHTLDLSGFTNHYEPQGELMEESQHPNAPADDFSIPLPVTHAETETETERLSPQHAPPFSPPSKPPLHSAIRAGMKRKAESEPNSAVSPTTSGSVEPQQQPPSKRPNNSRSSSQASLMSPTAARTTEAQAQAPAANAPVTAEKTAAQSSTSTTNGHHQSKPHTGGTGPQGRVIDVSKPRKVAESPGGADLLPAGKVFPIQIGSEMFRISGASISSDAPSYFTHFFGNQLHNNQGRAGDLRTLYIDRDPDTFRDIALHLQGYHITPQDGEHFVKLFADAQFYSLPRLTKQLFSTDIFIRIGGTPFQIPRDLFSAPGDSPNYFSLGFAQFFSTPSEVFPGLDRNALLRPPSIRPPAVPNRNGETFAELVRLLQGYNIEIRSQTHRSQLLRDARYFHLKGLEQKLVPCDISYNLMRQQSEILIGLEDIRQSGVSFTPDQVSDSSSPGSNARPSPFPENGKSPSPRPPLTAGPSRAGTVSYARPYTDDHSHTNILILEVSSSESTVLHLPITAPKPASSQLALHLRATFRDNTLARITSLFSVIASKMGLPATQPLGLMMLQSGGGVAAQPISPANSGVSERRVRVRISSDCHMEMDNSPVELGIDPKTARLGVKRVSREQIKNEGDADLSKSDWIWGGGKEDDCIITGLDGEEQGEEWVIQRAHWRLRVEPVADDPAKMQVVLFGVRIEGHTRERSRNRNRGFLGQE